MQRQVIDSLKGSLIMNSLNTLIIGLGKIGCLYDYEIPFSFNNPKSSKYISTILEQLHVIQISNLFAD